MRTSTHIGHHRIRRIQVGVNHRCLIHVRTGSVVRPRYGWYLGEEEISKKTSYTAVSNKSEFIARPESTLKLVDQITYLSTRCAHAYNLGAHANSCAIQKFYDPRKQERFGATEQDRGDSHRPWATRASRLHSVNVGDYFIRDLLSSVVIFGVPGGPASSTTVSGIESFTNAK
ncbi:hypothetical protein SAMN04515620_13143 [Collimonas sp. OK607]|uniref:hypothetical protein n=1 Tax=Collimonas sp. OK607 TaxID=1798194 RepID=UPI0008E0F1A5|nr:hypothetical protein [Collimonas sp. OK607]SFB25549.1 hypothetical protein SAMN04515620_13143 [Collimonas sp. OK607]